MQTRHRITPPSLLIPVKKSTVHSSLSRAVNRKEKAWCKGSHLDRPALLLWHLYSIRRRKEVKKPVLSRMPICGIVFCTTSTFVFMRNVVHSTNSPMTVWREGNSRVLFTTIGFQEILPESTCSGLKPCHTFAFIQKLFLCSTICCLSRWSLFLSSFFRQQFYPVYSENQSTSVQYSNSDATLRASVLSFRVYFKRFLG